MADAGVLEPPVLQVMDATVPAIYLPSEPGLGTVAARARTRQTDCPMDFLPLPGELLESEAPDRTQWWVDSSDMSIGMDSTIKYKLNLRGYTYAPSFPAVTYSNAVGEVRSGAIRAMSGLMERRIEKMATLYYDVSDGASWTAASTSATCPGYGTSSITGSGIYAKVVSLKTTMSTAWATTDDATDWPPVFYAAGGTTTHLRDTYWQYANLSATSTGWSIRWHDDVPAPISPQNRLTEIIRDRMAPRALSGRRANASVDGLRRAYASDFREQRALETLSKVVGPEKYRRFIRDGFVTARAKSGLSYQIFPGGGFTRVYKHGVEVERLCVVLQGGFPPTDSLILRYIMILNDEERFRSLAIRHQPSVRREVQLAQTESSDLPSIYRGLKLAQPTKQSKGARKAAVA